MEKGLDFGREDLIQNIMETLFEKGQKDSRKKPIHGLAKYLSVTFLEDFQFSINVNTFTRYYKGYILKSGKKQEPTENVLNAMCRYLGHRDFKGFEAKSQGEFINKELLKEIEHLKKRSRKREPRGLMVILALLMALLFYSSKYYEKNCMVWTGDHYEKVRCSGLANETALDNETMENMRRVSPCDSVPFFRYGKPAVWYDTSNGQYSFFTYHGLHPTNGKTLRPITREIVDSMASPCKASSD